MEKCRWMITFVDVRRRFAIIERAQSFLRNFNELETSKWHALCHAPIRAQVSFPSRAVLGSLQRPVAASAARKASLNAIITPSNSLITLTQHVLGVELAESPHSRRVRSAAYPSLERRPSTAGCLARGTAVVILGPAGQASVRSGPPQLAR